MGKLRGFLQSNCILTKLYVHNTAVAFPCGKEKVDRASFVKWSIFFTSIFSRLFEKGHLCENKASASAGTRTRVATLGGLHPTPGLLTRWRCHSFHLDSFNDSQVSCASLVKVYLWFRGFTVFDGSIVKIYTRRDADTESRPEHILRVSLFPLKSQARAFRNIFCVWRALRWFWRVVCALGSNATGAALLAE